MSDPNTANEVLARVNNDHEYRHEPADLNSTGGIQRAIRRQDAAIQALADHIDRVNRKEVDGSGLDKNGNPIDPQRGPGGLTPPGPNGPDDYGASEIERNTPATEATKQPGYGSSL